MLTGCVDVAYVRRPVDERGLKLVPLYTERRLAALPPTTRSPPAPSSRWPTSPASATCVT